MSLTTSSLSLSSQFSTGVSESSYDTDAIKVNKKPTPKSNKNPTVLPKLECKPVVCKLKELSLDEIIKRAELSDASSNCSSSSSCTRKKRFTISPRQYGNILSEPNIHTPSVNPNFGYLVLSASSQCLATTSSLNSTGPMARSASASAINQKPLSSNNASDPFQSEQRHPHIHFKETKRSSIQPQATICEETELDESSSI